MIRVILTTILLTTLGTTYSQKIAITYHDSTWLLTTKNFGQYYRTGIITTDKYQYYGEVKDYYMNGTLQMKGKFSDWAFGCDVCQDVCPWNKFSKPHSEPLFNPNSELISMSKKDWTEITEETFKAVFKNSPLKRAKFEGIKRNIDFIK